MAENMKRVNVTLPVDQYERIRRVLAEHPRDYPTVSAFVSQAVADRLETDEAHRMLLDVLSRTAGPPDDEDRAWAAEALRVGEQTRTDLSGSGNVA